MREVIFRDLGLIDYKKAWDEQELIFNTTIAAKLANRVKAVDDREKSQRDFIGTKNYLLFCEHPHVFTLGKSGSEENLLANEDQLKEKEATFYKINRGGDITYHGPGQLVVYPIFDLDHFFTDIHKYLRFLEEAVILTLREYGITAGRIEGLTGVWLDVNDPQKARKICAMGVKCSRWVTMHGIGFNINTRLEYFNHIIPCGINDKQVTSLNKELQREISMDEVKEKLKQNLANIFDFDYVSE